MLKRIIFFNLIFLSTTLLYFLAQNFSFKYYSSFYLCFSVFCMVSSVTLFFTDLSYKDWQQRHVFQNLFIGFFIYGLANFSWFLNEEFLNNSLPENYFNILFAFQVLTKFHLFYYYIQDLKSIWYNFTIKLIILVFLVLVCLFSIFSGIEFDFNFNTFFIIETLTSILLLIIYLNNISVGLIDFKYFIAGEILWLIGDILYLNDFSTKIHFIGSIVDFCYFLGFYLFLASVIYKNFAYDLKLKISVAKDLFYI